MEEPEKTAFAWTRYAPRQHKVHFVDIVTDGAQHYSDITTRDNKFRVEPETNWAYLAEYMPIKEIDRKKSNPMGENRDN